MKLKKLLTTILLVVLTAMSSNAQKLSLASQMLIAQQKNVLLAKSKGAVKAKNVLTAILLEKGCNVSDETLSTYGIQVEKRRGRLILAHVPINRLESLTAIEGIRSIDTGREAKPYNDRAREATSVVFVHDKDVEQGKPDAADVPTKYRGKGVYVGIVDGDIDLGHPAFRDAQGKSRIKKAIVTRYSSQDGVSKYFYDESIIEDGIIFRMDDDIYNGHGTHVAGIAAGSTALLPEGDPMKKYYGMAPEADLLTFDLESYSSNYVLMAITEAFDKADEDGRPLVLNMSIGLLGIMLDGSDDFNEKLTALLETYDLTGKIICVSSGNNAEKTVTAQIECDKPIVNGEWTLQKKLALPLEQSELNMAEFCGVGNKEFAIQYEFRYIPKSGGDYMSIATSPILTRDNYQEHVNAAGAWVDRTITAEGDTIRVMVMPNFRQSSTDRMYHSGLLYTINEGVYAVANIYSKEEGVCVDALSQNLPFMTMEGDEYAIPNNQGCFNAYACSDNTISVGSYNTRNTFTTIDGNEFVETSYGEEGEVSSFSGYCTPHYGKARPDVIAPGAYILSAMHHNNKRSIQVGTTTYKDVDYQWGAISGTSQASPVVAGTIALWLQADPTLTVEDVRKVIAKTSDFDDACAVNPYRARHGKINALRGLEYILSSSGIKEVSTDNNSGTVKFLNKNNQLIIHRGGHLYDAVGRKLR